MPDTMVGVRGVEKDEKHGPYSWGMQSSGEDAPNQCCNRDTSGGLAGLGTWFCLEEAEETWLDDDPQAGLPHESFQLTVHSYRGQKISVQ